MLQEIQDLFSYHLRSTRQFARHDFFNVYLKTLRDISSFGFDGLAGKSVLDLGCGQRYPFALLTASEGARVTALDLNYVAPVGFTKYFSHILRANGVKRAIKSSVRRLLFDRAYFSELNKVSKKDLASSLSGINFIIADPTTSAYPLPTSSFDLIASNAVLEHVSDVEGYFKEVSRLLKPEGIFYGIIHNFYSLSGGHNLGWAYPDEHPSRNVPPWDHLRENLFPSHVYLNRLRPEEYRAAAAAHLLVLQFEGRDINHDPGSMEGRQFLDESMLKELRDFPESLLLTRSYCIICKNTHP